MRPCRHQRPRFCGKAWLCQCPPVYSKAWLLTRIGVYRGGLFAVGLVKDPLRRDDLAAVGDQEGEDAALFHPSDTNQVAAGVLM